MKVLLIGNYNPDRQRSMQRFAQQLADGLTARGADVELLKPPVIIGKLGAQPTGIGKWIGYLDKFILFPWVLKQRLKESAPDIVHICDHSNAHYTRYLQSVPHLVTCHDLFAISSALGEIPQNPVRRTGRILQDIILKGLKKSHYTVSVSQSTAADLARICGNNPHWTEVIPNSLDDAFIQAAETTDSGLPRPPKLLHIGGEKWYKNRSAVLAIFARMAKANHELSLHIIGPPFTEEQLVKNGCEDLSNRIHMNSGISDDELRELYHQASMLLFPSLTEGFGWPILEAQACGCPVLTRDAAPMSELNALSQLCVNGDPSSSAWLDSMAEAASSYLNSTEVQKVDDREQMKRFAATYTNEAAVNRYIVTYKKLGTTKD